MTPNIALKNILANFSYRVGVLNCLRIQKRRSSAFVLTYHRVLRQRSNEPHFVQPGMYVTTTSFRNQVAFLKESFHVVPLAELVERIRTGKSVGGCCAITFDDGWHDNFTQAFPILQELQVPATAFLATAFIETKRLFWPEEFTFYLRQPEVRASIGQRRVLARFLSEVRGSMTDDNFPDKAVVTLKTWTPQMREELLQELHFTCPALPPGRLLMNWAEVEEMQASGLINIGAHTANHVILDQVPLKQAEEEIVNSRQELESRLGVSPEFFAYPNGNYSGDIQAILKRNGFKGAVTTRKGCIDADIGLFEIPRIGMHEDVSFTIPLFFARILLERF